MESKEQFINWHRAQQKKSEEFRKGMPAWISEVTGMIHDFAGWLRDEDIQITIKTFENEEFLAGKYPILGIEIGNPAIVRIAPVARWVCGGTGRIDFSLPGRPNVLPVRLIRDLKCEWQFFDCPGANQPLTTTSFWDALNDLAERAERMEFSVHRNEPRFWWFDIRRP